jgi:predicted regulator of Ras-like GTPase activity (Roadblock/LC7/MglB family)
MPFLNWFHRKSKSTEGTTRPFRVENLATKQAIPPETVVAHIQQETPPRTLPKEQLSPDLDPIAQHPKAPSHSATSEIHAPTHISVPIGAFYAKLPAHLLAPEKPDLERFVQIAEEDVVLDHETREATLPLAILSLSCPEIFVRAVEGSDDVPVTFSLSDSKESKPPSPEVSAGLKETEAPLTPAATAPTSRAEVGESAAGDAKEITLRLQPILSGLPPELEPPSIHTLIETQSEIRLPQEMILLQLAHGRVVIPCRTFLGALPIDLKPYFEAIDPAAEIPIPLQEVFSQLPPEAIQLREDQEMDGPEEPIPTPFSAHAEEDAKRFGQIPAEEIPPAIEASPPKEEPPKVTFETDSKRLRAIFMTDDPLDLTVTIHKVAELPGLKSCILSTTDGLKLAGTLGEPDQEKAISAMLPELFDWTQSKLKSLRAGTLETITLYYGLHQLSTFVHGKLCLTVLHDNRPFKPGVREKIQAVIGELADLSTSEKTT